MREAHHIARLQTSSDAVLVDLGLAVVGGQHHDDIAPRRRIPDVQDIPAVGARAGGVLVLDVAHDDIDARVLHVERLAAPLVAVADDGNGLAVEQRKVGVVVEVESGHGLSPTRHVFSVAQRSCVRPRRAGRRRPARSPNSARSSLAPPCRRRVRYTARPEPRPGRPEMAGRGHAAGLRRAIGTGKPCSPAHRTTLHRAPRRLGMVAATWATGRAEADTRGGSDNELETGQRPLHNAGPMHMRGAAPAGPGTQPARPRAPCAADSAYRAEIARNVITSAEPRGELSPRICRKVSSGDARGSRTPSLPASRVPRPWRTA